MSHLQSSGKISKKRKSISNRPCGNCISSPNEVISNHPFSDLIIKPHGTQISEKKSKITFSKKAHESAPRVRFKIRLRIVILLSELWYFKDFFICDTKNEHSGTWHMIRDHYGTLKSILKASRGSLWIFFIPQSISAISTVIS